MSKPSPIDLAQAGQILDLQNGSNSLESTTRRVSTSHDQTSPILSSPDDVGNETMNQYIQSPVIPVVNPFGTMVVMVSTPDASDHQTTPPPPPPSLSPPQESLLSLLRNQLEYYFSKDNLATDKYLLSQMDSDHFVPVSVLANFNQVKRLSNDMNLIMEAIKDSNTLKLDPTETKVKAIPEKRCVLILREIPKETPKEDVCQLFSGSSCPKFLSCDFAENDCWYVTFSGEDEAQEAYRYLREEVRDFLGKPVRARIKNTTVQHSASLPKTRPSYPSYSSVQSVPFYQQPVVWPPYYTESPYASPYINGLPHSGFAGGVPSQRFMVAGSSRNVSAGGGSSNASVSNPRKAPSTSVTNMKGRHAVSSDTNDKKITVGGVVGVGNPGGNNQEGRYRRDEDRDRTRNLPNRFRKRNEERTTGTEDKIEKQTIDKEKSTVTSRQRFQVKSQPKLDFAPASFPPLPGQSDSTIMPLPLPPPTSPEANLADIVKGRHGLTDVVDVKTTANTSKAVESKPLLSPVSTAPSKSVSASVQISKPDTRASSYQSSEKDTTNLRYNVSRNVHSVRGQGNNGGRNRYRDSRDLRKGSSSGTRNYKQVQKQVNNASDTVSVTPPPTPSTDETDNNKDEDKEESLKSEKKSYAQMAGKKMKPSTSSSSTSEGVSSCNIPSSPPVSPNEVSESNASSPVSPLPQIQSDQTTSS